MMYENSIALILKVKTPARPHEKSEIYGLKYEAVACF